MHYPVFLAGAVLATTFMATAAAAAPRTSSCDVAGQDLTPVGQGPLVLASAHCLELSSVVSRGASLPVLSTDRKAFFAFTMGGDLWLGKVDSEAALLSVEADVAGSSAFSYELPFAWSDHGNDVFGVKQDVMKPRGGWALGPLTTFVASIDGGVRSLPPLTSPDGSLDEVHWIGNAGLAIVLFGAKGSYYRPEHPDPHPTIAWVDARAGRVIESVPLADLGANSLLNTIRQVSWRIDKKGRAEALLTLLPDRWILWKPGEAPQRLSIDINVLHSPYALSPDGQVVVIMRGLSATGMICEHNPRCPPLTPSTGVFAELRDVRTGRMIWSLTGTAESGRNDILPAISPDGRYGLIGMPANHQGGAAALVEMASGKVLQTIPVLAGLHGRLGFSLDSKTAWVSGYSRVAEYRITY